MIDMESTKSFFDGLVTPVMLAAVGGIARAFRFGFKGWRQFCGSVVVSGFTGVVVHLMLSETGISQSIQAALVATSGYSGGAILDALVAGLARRVEKISSGEGK